MTSRRVHRGELWKDDKGTVMLVCDKTGGDNINDLHTVVVVLNALTNSKPAGAWNGGHSPEDIQNFPNRCEYAGNLTDLLWKSVNDKA